MCELWEGKDSGHGWLETSCQPLLGSDILKIHRQHHKDRFSLGNDSKIGIREFVHGEILMQETIWPYILTIIMLSNKT